ncbi:unnamed protein product [Citrullus colocynthis]|uniref:Uncharacterized protein n=1 Tax=Citrullus colocynthis TaxID=252529 RepID=A0ABP0XYE9_9ROSI
MVCCSLISSLFDVNVCHVICAGQANKQYEREVILLFIIIILFIFNFLHSPDLTHSLVFIFYFPNLRRVKGKPREKSTSALCTRRSMLPFSPKLSGL